MATKVLITTRRGRPEATTSNIARLSATPVREVEAGTLADLEEADIQQLEQHGFRVKRLPNAHLLEIGAYQIDTSGGTAVETKVLGPTTAQIDGPIAAATGPGAEGDRSLGDLEIPAARIAEWPHHLVQFDGLQSQEWMRAIERGGIKVVQPLSNAAAFVTGAPAEVKNLLNLPFVTWTGPFKPAYRISPELEGMTGEIRNVRVTVYPTSAAPEVRQLLANMSVNIISENTNGDDFFTFIVLLQRFQLAWVAREPHVYHLEFAAESPGLEGEVETQIVAENLDATGVPVPGYAIWISSVGVSGNGVSIAICDTGVSDNARNNTTGHLDLRGRQSDFIDYTAGRLTRDVDGHGTHVAGVAVGNGGSGALDWPAPRNFLSGQGVAPDARFVGMNALKMSPWPPRWQKLTGDAVSKGADVMNNSWNDGGGSGAGYTSASREFDQLVRDANFSTDRSPGTDALTPLTIVFAAGNNGPFASTITPPKEAKNPVVVGNSHSHRPELGLSDIRGIWRSSSRGPARDGRLLPHVVAPGTSVSAAKTGTTNIHVKKTGTSMAAPHVAGACALLIERWRLNNGGVGPSPAMLKALLINGAEDLQGGPDGRGGVLAPIPNHDQGWGRVSLKNLLQNHPDSDRGPRLHYDQDHPLTATQQEHSYQVEVHDQQRPLRITLAWTDAPGTTGARPALVNDLDLEVEEIETARIFKGNVFSNGFSVVGGSFDNLNNVECVYIEKPKGTYMVRVVAGNLVANARPPFDLTAWQDYALVADNVDRMEFL